MTEGKLLWEPSKEWIENSNIRKYMKWLSSEKGIHKSDYSSLWEWSVTDLDGFWGSIWEYFHVEAKTPFEKVLADQTMPGAKWFTGATLNYAEHIFRNRKDEKDAILFASEGEPIRRMNWKELETLVAAFSEGLKSAGVEKGDRVVAYIPNSPHAVIAFLACASIGAIWSSCSPEFGTRSVVDRFKQIEPKVFIAIDGYRYNGKPFNRIDTVKEIQEAIPTLEKTVLIPYLNRDLNGDEVDHAILWDAFINQHPSAELQFEPVSFEHPLWILFSSGTTGIPKAIVQGHGGILLEHLKALTLHTDLGPDDRFFWYTTTGWMMWNFLVGGLLTGAAIILYDGSPTYPDNRGLWQLVQDTKLTVFGTSAGYLTSCMKDGMIPKNEFDLTHLKAIGSTGSPLPANGFDWIYESVKEDLWVASVSGGTDVCSAFVLGVPILPVKSGHIQCRGLGAAVYSFDDQGQPQTDAIGELVITKPLPSMPLFFWNDPKGERYHDSYFDTFPGIWRHGDYIKVTAEGGCVIYGRSDATINRGGVRMGTSEIYSAVESVPEVKDSLIVDVPVSAEQSNMFLFVVLGSGVELNEEMTQKIKQKIRTECSPRHVPDKIYTVDEIPYTINGKKLEVPVKKILMGTAVEKAANPGSLKNPDSLAYFIELREQLI
ncbi:MAG: acetoacetate--CoA ligase [Tuberibacillus sp.]